MNRAQLYSSANALQTRDAAAALSLYCDVMSWPEECFVLDVGCGSGDVTSKLLLPALKRCSTVTAVDVSPSMVKFAASKHQHPNLNFRCLDIVAPDLRPRAIFPTGFHKIFSFYCLHWISNQRQAFSNMFDLLLPGGELLVVFLASNPIFTVYERLSQDSNWSRYMKDASKFVSPYQHSDRPDDDLRDHLDMSGFTIKDCNCLLQHFAFPSVNALKSAIKAVNPFIDRIPKEMHEDYLNDCIDEFNDMGCVNDDGTVSADYRLLVAFAKKSK
ncbi:juvenile hormone acid O-methyltransferase [Neocloeon triangulifer]|uniref:juvenile hormone acid O-methyltransferase n=1 Tax=Neocloeon triangulifer TaxID=2078957 RepID=UPI00286F7AD2|nr:juvenile hormone acid O-methyltransferase [Neocloeon triangulifer]